MYNFYNVIYEIFKYMTFINLLTEKLTSSNLLSSRRFFHTPTCFMLIFLVILSVP